jgi:hypothetical protein
MVLIAGLNGKKKHMGKSHADTLFEVAESLISCPDEGIA